MAESLLLPVVDGVAGKAADALVQTVTRMWGVDDDRCKLERQLLAVQRKLADAEVKAETDQFVKRWMKDFRTVAYEADNVLDDFQYEALRREAQIGGSKTRKVLSHFTNHSPLLFRLIMSRKLSNVLEKINNLVDEMNKFGLVENRAEAPQGLYRQTHSALDESAEIFGREDDKEKVVELLLNQQDQKNVQVLPIFGMGGLGKTTLAKMVYNDYRVKQHFHLNMWHCVSDNFEATAVVKSVIELATQRTCDLRDTIELLRGRLQEVIGQKRYLLVLDDVWNEDDSKWEDQVKPLLCSVGGPGSVIVVTCRSQQVASIMGTLGPHGHELAYLNEDDSWELFSKKAFSNGVEKQAELVTIGRRIVKKCGGLPLALKTMGGLMSSKQQVQEWEAIEKSNIRDNARGKDAILSILKLSYQHLTPEMKQCFAFCAVFPKDYEMEKDILIQLWMANGFFQEEDTMDLAQKGEFIFRYLVWRSFLQDVKVGKISYYSIKYESTVCKMHDLMHDLAKDVTDECVNAEELIQQKASLKEARHMQIGRMSMSKLKQINELLKGTTSLCTLLMPSTEYMDLERLKLKSMRALCCHNFSINRFDCSSITSIQLVNAKHLRYLDLSGNDMVTLPDSVSSLYNLQTLRLNGCLLLQRLPEGISAMRKLIHLYLLECVNLEQMPPNMSLLNDLRTLTTFVVGTEAGRGIEELKDLCHLGNRLELYNLSKIKSRQNAMEANLYQKQNLSELLLFWGRYKDEKFEHEACNEEQVLEYLAPHSKLQILEVHGYNGLEVVEWMRDRNIFQCLRKLTVSNCPRCKDLPRVWLSVPLEYMCIEKMDRLTTFCNSIEVEAEGYNTRMQYFPKLKEMVLHGLPSLEKWTEDSVGEHDSLVMFTVLEVLKISDCPKLTSVPDSPVLKKLTIISCTSLPISSLTHLTTVSDLHYSGIDTSMPLRSWPSVVRLEVSSLTNMMMVPLEDQPTQSQTRPLETLGDLSLEGSNCSVTPSSLSKSQLGPWECFAFVEELLLAGCNGMVRWPVEELRSLPRLRSLEILYCYELEGKGSSSEETLPLPHLETLSIHNCASLLEIPKLPASLEHLEIQYCSSLVALPLNLGDLAKLRFLHMWSCDGLKSLADGNEMDGLTSLEQLELWDCGGIKEFPQGLLQRLPALKALRIVRCASLLEIPKLPASLQDLWIISCSSLVALPLNLGDLAKLRVLLVKDCYRLKALADGNEMDGLTSLERLELTNCKGIEEVPQGLLQRLPALKSLDIEHCHDELQRRCREGGEYFRFLSSIPEKCITEPRTSQQEETGSSMNKLVRRLLPSCVDSN